MQGIFQKENTDKALKYGIYRHLPTYEKIIRNLVSFYFINLRIWEKMSITRIVYDGDKNTTCELIFPGVYRVENTRKGAYVNSFEIKRGKTLWFCDYYANEM